jgi:hypothetical protein
MVARMMCGIAMAELDLPHIVLTRNAATGEATYSGPYQTGLGALAAAEAEWEVDRDAGGVGDITFHVAALYPPLDRLSDLPWQAGLSAKAVAPEPSWRVVRAMTASLIADWVRPGWAGPGGTHLRRPAHWRHRAHWRPMVLPGDRTQT